MEGGKKSLASEPPRSAHLCKKVGPNVSGRETGRREEEVERGNKGVDEIGTRRTLNHDVDGVCHSQSERRAEKCGKKKGGDSTIILHIQRRRRIVVVDPGPIIQKPIIVPKER